MGSGHNTIMSAIDSLTGHKSKHYSPTEALAYEANKAKQVPTGAIIRDDPYSSGIGPTGGSTYSTTDFGLHDTAMQQRSEQEEKAAVVRAAMKRITDQANADIMANNLAEETRMGGKFTDKGLQLADKNARLNAEDRIKAKSLIGIGGSKTLRMGTY